MSAGGPPGTARDEWSRPVRRWWSERGGGATPRPAALRWQRVWQEPVWRPPPGQRRHEALLAHVAQMWARVPARADGGSAWDDDGSCGAEGTCVSHVQTLISIPQSIAKEAPCIWNTSAAMRASAVAVHERLACPHARLRPHRGSQLLVLSTARRHLDVYTPMHAEASSACTVMGTGVGKATLGAGV